MTVDELNGIGLPGFVAALAHLFERSPWIAAEAARRRPFRDGDALYAELCAVLRRAPRERQLELIRAHPELGGRTTPAGGLTAASAREQAGAGLDRLSAAAAAEFERLNALYRERFGFPFVICARLNRRAAILRAMRERLSREPEQEFEAALAEIERIARLRLDDVLEARTPPSAS